MKKIGREYQHIEDLLITHGSAGGLEALSEIMLAAMNPASMDYKWDGEASVFWGRNTNGEFVFLPKNQWEKQQMLTKDQLVIEIKNTGRPNTGQSSDNFCQSRLQLANKYAKLWDLFETATPDSFRGYLNGDLMFTSPPVFNTTTNEYEFTPNKVAYYVKSTGFNNKISTATTFVVIHGKLNMFGMNATDDIQAVSDIEVSEFNYTSELIVLNTQHPCITFGIDWPGLSTACQYIQAYATEIDELVNFTAPRFTTIKQVLYNYVVYASKNQVINTFGVWLNTNKISDKQKAIVTQLMSLKNWNIFWQSFNYIGNKTNDIIRHLEKDGNDKLYRDLGIRAMIGGKDGGEGIVKRAKSGKLLKIISPRFRSAPSNLKFINNV